VEYQVTANEYRIISLIIISRRLSIMLWFPVKLIKIITVGRLSQLQNTKLHSIFYVEIFKNKYE
jgi:hypothetical protein